MFRSSSVRYTLNTHFRQTSDSLLESMFCYQNTTRARRPNRCILCPGPEKDRSTFSCWKSQDMLNSVFKPNLKFTMFSTYNSHNLCFDDSAGLTLDVTPAKELPRLNKM